MRIGTPVFPKVQKMKGLISQTLDWLAHPSHSDASLAEWAAGLLLILVLSFLWSTVVRQIEA